MTSLGRLSLVKREVIGKNIDDAKLGIHIDDTRLFSCKDRQATQFQPKAREGEVRWDDVRSCLIRGMHVMEGKQL